MPNNRRLTKKAIKGKEGLHPGSRKAGQLNRVSLRTFKLQTQAKVRRGTSSMKLHRPVFFLHALSSPAPLSLPSLRALISTVYLTRHDERIAELEAERRAGRPKAKELVELEHVRKTEHAEWETGFEVPDLTHPETTKLLFLLQEKGEALQPSHVALIRQIRLFKNAPEDVIVSKVGKTGNMGLITGHGAGHEAEDWTEGLGEEIGMDET